MTSMRPLGLHTYNEAEHNQDSKGCKTNEFQQSGIHQK